VKSSSHMEKEGLIRSARFFESKNIKIKTLVTDRHVQIVKWVRENLTETTHNFDVWHVAKGENIFQINIFKYPCTVLMSNFIIVFKVSIQGRW